MIAPHMAAHDWLGSYREFEVLERVLANMSRRLSDRMAWPADWPSWSSCTNRCSRISATSIQRFSNSPERPEALVPQAS